ncbi:hypothetical protein [Streptomyces sp. x-19]|uniref:hypothetical protein n=1 Tax=Streptomyces sp. x-19 TaxID=2789280 RepID=UPI0039809574
MAEVKSARKVLGTRRLPAAGGERPAKGRAYHLRQSNRWRAIEHSRTLAKTSGWDSAVLAAAFGAFTESEPQHIRSGLVRLAALAVAAVESLDQEAA